MSVKHVLDVGQIFFKAMASLTATIRKSNEAMENFSKMLNKPIFNRGGKVPPKTVAVTSSTQQADRDFSESMEYRAAPEDNFNHPISATPPPSRWINGSVEMEFAAPPPPQSEDIVSPLRPIEGLFDGSLFLNNGSVPADQNSIPTGVVHIKGNPGGGKIKVAIKKKRLQKTREVRCL